MVFTLAIELRVELGCHCGKRSRVAGVVADTRCPGCGRTYELSDERWACALDETVHACETDDDGAGTRWDTHELPELRVEYRRRPLAPGAVRVRELPEAIAVEGLPRPVELFQEPGGDAFWLVATHPDAIGMFHDTGRVCGVAGDGDGGIIVAFEPCRLARLGSRGEITWRQAAVTFSTDAYLVGTASGAEVALVEPQASTVRFLDVRDGSVIRTLNGPDLAEIERERQKADDAERDFRMPEPQAIAVHAMRVGGLGIGADGTIAIARDWLDGRLTSVRRFDQGGAPLPSWAPPERHRWLKIALGLDRPPKWDRIGDRPHVLPPMTRKLAVARDGSLIAYGQDERVHWLVRWLADGTRAEAVRLPDWIVDVLALGGDGRGTPVLLLDRGEGEGVRHRHVGVVRNGELVLVAGPHAPAPRSLIDDSDELLHVFADGSMVVGHGTSSLRLLGPDGVRRWRSPETARKDRSSPSQKRA